MRLLDFFGSIAFWFVCLLSPDWFIWPGDSAREGSEMVRCNGAPGLSTLPRAFLCLNSGGKKSSSQRILDQYPYLGNCPPTPPLTQQQSIDNKLGLMLG